MELKREAMNSAKLKMHFEDNPQELKLLRHGASKKLIRPVPHLRDIPDYLIPDALKTKSNVREESGKRDGDENSGEKKRRRVLDPLQVGKKEENKI
jgi:ATP-dependent RNA helicase DDX56/DBP9